MTTDPPLQTDLETLTVGLVDSPPVWPPVRHPFQLWSMGTFLTLGAGWILNPSVALKDVLGEPWVLVWSIILVISGSCGLISAIYSRRDEGLSLLTERVALIGVSGFSALYLGALIAYAGFTVWVIEIMFLFLFIACVWRFIQVWIRIRWCKQIGRTTVPRWRP